MRVCSYCRKTKPIDDFSKQSKQHDWLDSRCKRCRADLQSARRKPKRAIKPYKFPKGLTEVMFESLSLKQRAYIAGLIDGEGSIWSSHPKSNDRPLNVVVTMTHRPTIEWLCTMLGVKPRVRRSKESSYKQGWTCCITGMRSLALLKVILPFMRAKRDEAVVGIQLGETFFSNLVRGRVTDLTLAKRERYGQRLRDLKKVNWPE